MNYVDIAKKIPGEYRAEILQLNSIDLARASADNPSMIYLFTVWKNFIQPDEGLDSACGSCLQNILNNWYELKGTLIKMEKKSNLLKNT